MTPKRICVVLTSRGNYGKMKSVIKLINKHDDLEICVIVGGSLLLDKYGRILESEYADDIPIDYRLNFVVEGENLLTMAKSAGLALIEFSSAFQNLQPDVVIVIADRFECLPVAMAAAYMNIPVAHIEGGELSGSIDESIRHAITKLAHIHFPASQRAAKRIIRMGEKKASVFCVGSSSLDILRESSTDLATVREYQQSHGVGEPIALASRKFLLVIQHPVTTEYAQNYGNTQQTINAIDDLKMPTLWIWPNMDAGSDGTSKAVREFREKRNPSHVQFLKSAPIEIFGPLLANAACIVGNSSTGIREAAYLGTPTVNIGSRQQGRERSANVVDVDYGSANIAKAIEKQLQNREYASDDLYGDGFAAEKIVDVLRTYQFDAQKRNAF
jgi:UDP-hydrolysing UDP-N-acetyl-D-glucosamine 2-epimerase